MRRSSFSLLTVLFLMSALAMGLAQRHEIPQLNSCIKEFYDPEMYNWLTYRNDCTQALTIVFIAKDGSGASGTMNLRPGGKDSIGTMKGVVPKVGGFDLYVCPLDQMPLDDDGNVVSRPEMKFHCQAKQPPKG